MKLSSYSREPARYNPGANEDKTEEESAGIGNDLEGLIGFDLDEFARDRLSLDTDKLDTMLETTRSSVPKRIKPHEKYTDQQKNCSNAASNQYLEWLLLGL